MEKNKQTHKFWKGSCRPPFFSAFLLSSLEFTTLNHHLCFFFQLTSAFTPLLCLPFSPSLPPLLCPASSSLPPLLTISFHKSRPIVWRNRLMDIPSPSPSFPLTPSSPSLPSLPPVTISPPFPPSHSFNHNYRPLNSLHSPFFQPFKPCLLFKPYHVF